MARETFEAGLDSLSRPLKVQEIACAWQSALAAAEGIRS